MTSGPLSGGASQAASLDVDAVEGGVAPPVEGVLPGQWSPSYPGEAPDDPQR